MSSRHRQSTTQATPNRRSIAATPGSSTARNRENELPPYRKPAHPLDDRAQIKLRNLYSERYAKILRDHQNDAARLITETAGLINEALYDREGMVERKRKKWDVGAQLEEREEAENSLEELRKKVDAETAKLEESMRGVIDTGEAAHRISDTATWIRDNGPRQVQEQYDTQMSQAQTQASQSRRGRRTVDDDDQDEMEDSEAAQTPGPTPLTQARTELTGPSEMFSARMDRKKTEYTSLSYAARYSKNNDYIGFKRMVHETRYGEGPPMPHADTWFTESGAPAPGITATQPGQDDDDDVVVDKATISTRCPITLQQMTQPYTSKKCPHTFEKKAVLDLIRQSRTKLNDGQKAIQCPLAGCDQMLTASDLHEDLVIIRKIKRMQAADAMEAEDSDEEEEENEMVESGNEEDGQSEDGGVKLEASDADSVIASTQRSSRRH